MNRDAYVHGQALNWDLVGDGGAARRIYTTPGPVFCLLVFSRWELPVYCWGMDMVCGWGLVGWGVVMSLIGENRTAEHCLYSADCVVGRADENNPVLMRKGGGGIRHFSSLGFFIVYISLLACNHGGS